MFIQILWERPVATDITLYDNNLVVNHMNCVVSLYNPVVKLEIIVNEYFECFGLGSIT